MTIESLRAAMRDRGLSALVVSHSDAHASEYLRAWDERVALVSGFTGSAGTLLLLHDWAGLWTDGRYFEQAERELDKTLWTLMRQGDKDVPSLEDFVQNAGKTRESSSPKRVKSEFVVGLDADTANVRFCERLAGKCDQVKLLSPSLVNLVLRGNQGPPKLGRVFSLALEIAGRSVADKLAAARVAMKAKSCHACVVSALDDVAWALNLRGEDIPYNPVFFAHLVLTETTATLYADHEGIPLGELESSGVTLAPYRAVFADLGKLAESSSSSSTIWIDPASTNCALLQACVSPTFSGRDSFKTMYDACKSKFSSAPSFFKTEKPKKTPQEIAAMRRAQVSDGAALCRFLARVETDSSFLERYPDECDLADALEEFRRKEDAEFVGNSFATISSFAENAAVIHYHPRRGSCKRVFGAPANVYLVDSGGHYSYGGTTDTTRTVWIGGERDSERFLRARRSYTVVLRAHVALAMCRFPASGVTPNRFDSVARVEMWNARMNFEHGTGHGVGCWLCVHEMPPLIAGGDVGPTLMVENMCVTNEPGYYEPGEFGFRIENLMFAVKDEKDFLQFDTITWAPYCRDLIDPTLLDPPHLAWIDAYHARCRDALRHKLESDSATWTWLARNTEPFVI